MHTHTHTLTHIHSLTHIHTYIHTQKHNIYLYPWYWYNSAMIVLLYIPCLEWKTLHLDIVMRQELTASRSNAPIPATAMAPTWADSDTEST